MSQINFVITDGFKLLIEKLNSGERLLIPIRGPIRPCDCCTKSQEVTFLTCYTIVSIRLLLSHGSLCSGISHCMV